VSKHKKNHSNHSLQIKASADPRKTTSLSAHISRVEIKVAPRSIPLFRDYRRWSTSPHTMKKPILLLQKHKQQRQQQQSTTRGRPKSYANWSPPEFTRRRPLEKMKSSAIFTQGLGRAEVFGAGICFIPDWIPFCVLMQNRFRDLKDD